MLGKRSVVFWCLPTKTMKAQPRPVHKGCRLERERSDRIASARSHLAAVTFTRAPGHSCTWLSVDSVDSSGLRRDGFGRP